MRRDEEGRVPVPAQVLVGGVGELAAPQLGEPRLLRRGGRLGRVGTLDDDRVFEHLVARPPARLLQRGALAGRQIQAPHVAALRLRIHDVRVGRVLRGVEAVAAADRDPVAVVDRAVAVAARPAPRAVVLQSRADVIRERHIVADDVRLRDGDHVEELEVPAAVPRLRHAAVVADDEVTRVVGIDPHGVVIHVDALRRVADGLAAVVGEVDGRRGPVHAVGVLGIGAHLGVVEGADVVAVHLGPRRAAVARAVQAGGTRLRRLGFVDARIGRGVRFDERVDHFGVAARDGEPDAPL